MTRLILVVAALAGSLGDSQQTPSNWDSFDLVDDTCQVLATAIGETTVKSFSGETAESRCERRSDGSIACTTAGPDSADADVTTSFEVWGEDGSLLALHTPTRANRLFIYKGTGTFVWTSFSFQELGTVLQKQCAGKVR